MNSVLEPIASNSLDLLNYYNEMHHVWHLLSAYFYFVLIMLQYQQLLQHTPLEVEDLLTLHMTQQCNRCLDVLSRPNIQQFIMPERMSKSRCVFQHYYSTPTKLKIMLFFIHKTTFFSRTTCPDSPSNIL